ncbi:MAG: tannase/feruloyl esterase family alpha/beta hydrolase [Gammaproteobacteria bacterium]|nr:tannase/feruloyl esterase family alpha/beta hydrolase [Gammaproteobacteria bacterium]
MPNGSAFSEIENASSDFTARVAGPLTVCGKLVHHPGWREAPLSVSLLEGPGGGKICLVLGSIPPEIRYIAYLPENWNGRLYFEGNGGYAGEALDDPPEHQRRLRAAGLGFAVAFTNTGHDAASEPGGIWAYNNREKELDYGFRAVHRTARTVKELIRSYYGRGPAFAYFDGCSTGGRQGFMSAQRFPADFDGILAGAPVFDLSHMLWQYWKNQMALDRTPLTEERLALLARFVNDRFDAADGIVDGVIGNPASIDFKPTRELPVDAQGQDGFTPAEMEMLDQIYAPVVVAGQEIFPRTVVGGEARGLTYRERTLEAIAPVSAWHTRVVPDADGRLSQREILDSWFKYLAFDTDDPELDWRTLKPERDLPGMASSGRVFDAADPDLRAFHDRGGKMIVYHGWADFGVNPLRTISYYDSVRELMGTSIEDFLRLYLVPGMFHCWGGVNVDRFDMMTPLMEWVETGRPPGSIIGGRVENGELVRTRPLCPYPELARYRGTGDPDRHESFGCVRPDLPTPAP